MKRAILTGCLIAALAAGIGQEGADAARASTPSGFTPVSSPAVAGGSLLYGVSAVGAHDVWAVGSAPTHALAERWDGTQWTVVPTPASTGQTSLFGVAAKGGVVWAVGSGPAGAYAVRWSGSRFVVVPGIPSNVAYLDTVTIVSASNIWAGGSLIYAGPPVMLHWNGSSWTTVKDAGFGTDSGAISGLANRGASQVYATGWGDHGDADYQGWLERWNGSRWTNLLFTPNTAEDTSFAEGVGLSGPGNVWAVGDDVRNAPIAMRWTGATGSEIDPPGYATTAHSLDAVTTSGLSNVWAVGTRWNTTNTKSFTLIDHYNGTSWSDLGGPNVGTGDNSLNAITTVPGTSSNMWAVGAGGGGQPLILHHP